MLDPANDSPYKLSYNAPTATKRAHGRFPGGRQFEATMVEGVRGRKLAGFRTVRVGDHSITRTLVGAESPDEVTDEHLNALQGAMFGQHTALEGPARFDHTRRFADIRLSKESLDDLARQKMQTFKP